MAFNLATGVRAERKSLATIAEWESPTGTVYELLTSQPADWATSYTNYYTRTGSSAPYTYEAVTGASAPTFATSTYYRRLAREILGIRVEDSSIEFNADVSTITDILGITYTDVNKTEPQQSFDPFNIIGGSNLATYLVDAALSNDISKYNNMFNIYVVTTFITSSTSYFAVKHTGCSIIPTSIGGDAYVGMPIEVHYSNKITKGTVDKLADDFEFTPAS